MIVAQQISSFDYKKAYRRDLTKLFLQSLSYYIESTKPLVLIIESSSIYERFAVAHAIALKIQEINRQQEKKQSKVLYAFNKDDLEKYLNKTKNNDILIVDVEEAKENKYRKQIEIKNLNYIVLVHEYTNNISYSYKLNVLKEKNDLFLCLLFKNNFPQGIVKIKKREIDYDQLLEEIKSPVQKLIENVEYSTEQMLKKMYIPKSIIFMKKKNELRRTENAIIPQKILIYGDVGTGKSTLLEIFHGLDIWHYEKKHVHGRLHESDLQSLLVRGWSKDKQKWIQSINVEDYTYQGEKDLFTMHAYINLRHTMNEKTGGSRADRTKGIPQGMAKCRICLHRLTGDATPTAYRSSFDFQLFLDFPSLKFDRDYIESIIGQVNVAVLKYIAQKRAEAKEKGDEKEYKKWLGWGIWVHKEESGVFYLPAEKYNPVAIPILEAPENGETEESEEITHWHKWELEIRNKAAKHLAFEKVDFGGKKIRINLWGARDADIPKFDVDLCEIFLQENYPETKELIPRRRRNLAKDVLKLAKYLQYSEIAPERLENHHEEEREKERMFKWAQRNWKKIAEEGIEFFSGREKKPSSYEIKNWLVEKWKYRNKPLPKTINRIGFFQMIVDRIQSQVKDVFDLGGFSGAHAQRKEKMRIYPGSIVDKYRKALEEWAKENDQETTIQDLLANHFDGKSYSEIAVERDVNKNTISTNIKRAKRKINKISGGLWEQSIFSWILEQVEKRAKEQNLTVFKIANGVIVEQFPKHTESDIFAIAVNRLTSNHKATPHIVENIEKIFKIDFTNPPSSSSAFDLFLSSDLLFLFLWFGGKSQVDFLLFSRSSHSHFVFDAKVSHQSFNKNNRPKTSHTVSFEKLLPQSAYLRSHPGSLGVILFWSPFIGPKFVSHSSPDQSVTINQKSPELEEQLIKIIQEGLKDQKRPEKKDPPPHHKKRSEKIKR
ncbi:MAG: hypothetical protein ACTSSG_07300 [Candidatus Heimdallarchaeaceae archaeon]